METGGGETPSSSLSNAASSSSPSSGSGRPHSAGAVFSFNIPIGSSQQQSDTETVDSQELLAVIGDVDDDGGGRGGLHGDTMLFLLPAASSSSASSHHSHHGPYTPQHGPTSADSPHLLVQRQRPADTDTSPSENKENTAPNSPLVASANYKQGNYFRFPDVDGWPPGSVKINVDKLSGCSTPSDTLTLGILSPPDVLLPEAPRNSPMRRARLKSISLDSESAKAVEDTLNMGIQDLCIHPPPPSPSPDHEAGVATTPPPRHFGKDALEESHRRSFRNKNQLKIDLKQEEYQPDGVDSRQHPPTPKTPTLTQSRQKAISLDSDQGSSKPPTEIATNCCVPTVSASVPTTPKRHLVLSTHQPHGHRIHHHQSHHHHNHHQKGSHHFYQQQQHQQQHRHQQTSNLVMGGSASCRTKSRSTSEHLGSNLQRLKSVTLSVSNNNLKTLPEVMPLSDFGSSSTGFSKSSAGTPSAMEAPPFVVNPGHQQQQSCVTTPSKGRSSLLQRRGSNHSLTLNLAGSVGDLSGSTSHIAPSASGSGFGTKRGLLQRRGSNASLTLTIQGSDSALSRFNSHGSLNEARCHRKSLLSVSNCNLRSSMDVSRLRGPVGSKAGHHGKFFSSEENLNNNNKLSYCHIEPIDVVDDDEDQVGATMELVDFDDDGVRQITTKPLSPQSTSEDFKIYLANIQYLQNATNVLHVDDIRDLGNVFNDLGAYAALEHGLGGSVAQSRLTVEQEKHLNVQRRKLRKIHQEFWDLPTNHQEKPMVFGSQHKNRYKTILPNEHSRVILKSEVGDGKSEPYINANYIKGPADGTHELNYIATQGPMANTVFDFWLMAMQDTAGKLGPTTGNHTHNKIYSASFADSHRTCPVIVAEDVESGDEEEVIVPTVSPPLPPPRLSQCGEKLYILMLTNFMENGRPKCATYFPEKLGHALCFYSNSGSESQCEATCTTATTPLDSDDEEENEAPQLEKDPFRAWYEQNVRDDNASDWQWVKGLRRSSAGVSVSRPDLSQSESCFIVRNVGMREETGYSVRDLLVKYINGPARVCCKFVVEHYWFPDWPDHKSPEDLSVVLDFALDLLRVPGLTMSLRTPDSGLGASGSAGLLSSRLVRLLGEGRAGIAIGGSAGGAPGAKVVLPILHCSAGIGRTGCMAGILNALRQLHSGASQSCSASGAVNSPSQSQSVDILGIVCNLRLQRGGMVQNSEQYELIHRVLCLYQQKVDEAVGIFQPPSFLQALPSNDGE